MTTLVSTQRPHSIWNDPFFNRLFNLPQVDNSQPREFSPRIDVSEFPDSYVLEAELPGVLEDAVEITLQEGLLNIEGKREASKAKESESYRIKERHSGYFKRSLSLPDDADQDAIEASLKHGVLKLTIKKREEVKPRKILLK